MVKKKKDNKIKPDCKEEKMLVKEDGTIYCKKPKNKIEYCSFFSCNSFFINEENLTQNQRDILKYHLKELSSREIAEKIGISQQYVNQFLKTLRDSGELSLLKSINEKSKIREHIEEEEQRELQKIEPIKREETPREENLRLKDSQKTTGRQITKQIKQFPKKKSKKIKYPLFKLNLRQYPSKREAIMHTIDRWKEITIWDQVKELMKYISKYSYKIHPIILEKLKHLFWLEKHKRSFSRGVPQSRRIGLIEVIPHYKLYDGFYSVRELYEKIGLEFPKELNEYKDYVINNREDFEWIGIIPDLIEEIKRTIMETPMEADREYLEWVLKNRNQFERTERFRIEFHIISNKEIYETFPEFKEVMTLIEEWRRNRKLLSS